MLSHQKYLTNLTCGSRWQNKIRGRCYDSDVSKCFKLIRLANLYSGTFQANGFPIQYMTNWGFMFHHCFTIVHHLYIIIIDSYRFHLLSISHHWSPFRGCSPFFQFLFQPSHIQVSRNPNVICSPWPPSTNSSRDGKLSWHVANEDTFMGTQPIGKLLGCSTWSSYLRETTINGTLFDFQCPCSLGNFFRSWKKSCFFHDNSIVAGP